MPSPNTLSQSLASRRAGTESKATNQAAVIVERFNNQVADNGGVAVAVESARDYIGNNQLQTHEVRQLESSLSSLEKFLQTATEGFKDVSGTQSRAGVIAGMLAAAGPQSVFAAGTKAMPAPSAGVGIVDYTGQGDMVGTRVKAALESYDERDNKHATAYSVAYNFLTSRQDEFGEAFFRTVIVSPDQVGAVVTIRLVNVMDDIRRNISGDVDNFNKRNIIHGVIDHTILENDSTVIVPVVRPESEKNFVPVADLPPVDLLLGRDTISTSALAFGKRLSLIAISQTDSLLADGTMDVTDSVDTAVKLSGLILKVGADLIRINTTALQYTTFNYSVQGHYRQMRLAFDTDSLTLSGVINKANTNTPSTVLAPINTLNVTVKLSLSVNGSVNLETSETTLTASSIVVHAVLDEQGNSLPLTSGNGKTVADLFTTASAEGYYLDARRSNLNRRQRGQLLTTDFYSQIYVVPLHAPVTILRPVTNADTTDSSDLAALVTATHIRISNAAVTAMFNARDTLRDFTQTNTTGVVGQSPEILGAAAFLVKAFYHEEVVDLPSIIDSLRSHERAADLRAVLVNKIRDIGWTMWVKMGYKAAADALAGGVAPMPTIIVGTDQYIAQWLFVEGDMRTAGNNFDLKVVASQDARMRNQMFISLGQFGAGNDGVPDPLTFGNMYFKPELTVVLPMSRNGQISKELTVQPAFIHVVNLPGLAWLQINGIDKVVADKVTLNVADQNP